MGSSSVRSKLSIEILNFYVYFFRDETTPKFSDYRPIFYEGRAAWIQDVPIGQSQPPLISSTRATERTTTTHPFTQFDEKQPSVWTTTTRVCCRKRSWSFQSFFLLFDLANNHEQQWFSN